jgi:hypothetical protein
MHPEGTNDFLSLSRKGQQSSPRNSSRLALAAIHLKGRLDCHFLGGRPPALPQRESFLRCFLIVALPPRLPIQRGQTSSVFLWMEQRAGFRTDAYCCAIKVFVKANLCSCGRAHLSCPAAIMRHGALPPSFCRQQHRCTVGIPTSY